MQKAEPTCYMCDAPSVGKEHVPPKCLFPEEARFRKSFVKVPSCAAHNTGKSTDDELLRWILAAANAKSEIARSVLSNRVVPSFVKKPQMCNTFLRDYTFKFSEGGVFKSIAKLDFDRFYNSITSIVRGLYYHHTWHTHKALGRMKIIWDEAIPKEEALQTLNLSDDQYSKFTSTMPSQPNCPLGANPEVFRYGFDLTSDPQEAFCFLRFYEGKAIIVRWENGERQYTTRLESMRDYLEKFRSNEISGETETDLMRQLDEREAHLVRIMKEAKHKRDFGAFSLAKMLREKITETKKKV